MATQEGLASPAESAGIVANPFSIAAAMQVPPYLSGKMLAETTGVNYRVNHTIVSHEGILYLFGGRQGIVHYNTVLKYNPSGMSWSEVRVEGEPPVRRGDHSACVIGSKMFVYGGRKQLITLDDMFSLDLQTLTWKEINFEKSCGPGAVFAHSAVASQKLRTMYVVGGVHDQESKRHLVHAFDMYGKYWKNIAGPPGIDSSLIHMCQIGLDENSEKLFVVGLQDPLLQTGTTKLRKGKKRIDGLQKTASSSTSRNDPSIAPPQVLSVYFLNLQTLVWTKVRTVVSPSSVLPFTTPRMTELLLPNLHLCNSVVNATKGCWYFFALLNQDDQHDQHGVRPRDDHQPGGSEARAHYGFFIFDFVELKWSLSPVVVAKSKQPQHEVPVFSNLACSPFEGKYSLTMHQVKAPGGGERTTTVLFGGPIHADHLFLIMTPTLPPGGKPPSAQRRAVQEHAGDPLQPEKPATGNDSAQRRRKRREDSGDAVYIPFNPNFSAPFNLLDSSGVPLIKLDTEEKFSMWMHNYYKDQCKWLCDRRNEVESLFTKAQRTVKQKQLINSQLPRELDAIEVESEGDDDEPVQDALQRKGTTVKPVLKRALKRVAAIRKLQLPPNSLQFKREARQAQIEKKFCVRQLLFDSIEFQTIPLIEGRGARQHGKFLAKLRWKLLQRWVISGEAVAAMGTPAESAQSQLAPVVVKPTMSVSSVPQLALAPKLTYTRHVEGDSGRRAGPSALTVPQRPVPYLTPVPPPPRAGAVKLLGNGVVQYELNLKR